MKANGLEQLNTGALYEQESVSDAMSPQNGILDEDGHQMRVVNSIMQRRSNNSSNPKNLKKFNTISVNFMCEEQNQSDQDQLSSPRKNFHRFHDVSAQRQKAKETILSLKYTKKITGMTMFQNPNGKKPWKLIHDNVMGFDQHPEWNDIIGKYKHEGKEIRKKKMEKVSGKNRKMSSYNLGMSANPKLLKK